MKQYHFTVVVEKDEDGVFLARCPALQGCYAGGETREEALSAIEDVIRMHVEDRLSNGEPVNEEIYSSRVAVTV